MANARLLLSILTLAGLVWSAPSVDFSSSSGNDPLGPEATSEPWFRVKGGSPEQWARLADARDRFVDAGLGLPNLDVVFSGDSEVCRGALGYFSPSEEAWTISICNEHLTSIYAHELAHAWARIYVPADMQKVFLELRGLDTWNSNAVAWGLRGSEVAANVIALGLSDPNSLLSESGIGEKLVGFEELTGITPPRLSES